jgi:hypothetical protein
MILLVTKEAAKGILYLTDINGDPSALLQSRSGELEDLEESVWAWIQSGCVSYCRGDNQFCENAPNCKTCDQRYAKGVILAFDPDCWDPSWNDLPINPQLYEESYHSIKEFYQIANALHIKCIRSSDLRTKKDTNQCPALNPAPPPKHKFPRRKKICLQTKN